MKLGLAAMLVVTIGVGICMQLAYMCLCGIGVGLILLALWSQLMAMLANALAASVVLGVGLAAAHAIAMAGLPTALTTEQLRDAAEDRLRALLQRTRAAADDTAPPARAPQLAGNLQRVRRSRCDADTSLLAAAAWIAWSSVLGIGVACVLLRQHPAALAASVRGWLHAVLRLAGLLPAAGA